MNASFILSRLILTGSVLIAQQPISAPVPHAGGLGFTYALPSDWEVVDSTPTLSVAKRQAQQSTSSDDEKKGVSCVQIAFTARHGDPTSVIVVVELPFDCFGQSMSNKDLPGFAQGAAEGIKQAFDLSDPVTNDYKLGSHSMWIERAKGTPKGHPEATPYTVEIACTVLKKGAVCWMAMMGNDAALKTFEDGAVALEAEAPASLVPATAFNRKSAP